MSERPEPPRFAMERATIPPTYATPVRAEPPGGESGAARREQPPVAGACPSAPPSAMAGDGESLPLSPDPHGAGLLVAGIVYVTVVGGLILLAVCTYLLVSYEPPAPPAVCIAGPHQECSVQTVNGVYTTYYGYGGMIGLASPTPKRGTP